MSISQLRQVQFLFILLIISAAFCSDDGWASSPKKVDSKGLQQKNVIVLMMDGAGSTHTTITRWYMGKPMALDKMFLTGFRTYGADSLIIDSAPAATGFATGYKTNDKYVGIYPSLATIPGVPPIREDWKYKPLATVLEAAKVAGKSVGLIATSNIQHASPAGYSAHVEARSDYNEIAEQQVYLDIDVVFGGGKQYLRPNTQGGKRTDKEDLIQVLKNRGFTFIEKRQDLLDLPANTRKVWGMFANDDMAYEFDRSTLKPNEPSLSEMTQKAIEILSKNPKGFFLFVEASKLDWASHANDPIGVISDLVAFDGAVNISLDFAKKGQNTLVLAFSDHGNGGMSLGSRKTDNTYSNLPLGSLVDPLKKAKLTGEGIEAMLGRFPTEGKIKEIMESYYGISDLTPQEIELIQKTRKGFLNYTVGPMISSRSVIGWTTNGHGGEDLFLYYFGLNRPLPLLENTDIALLTSRHMGLDLSKTDQELFVPADLAFPALGASISIDSTDPANKALVVTKGAKTARLPFSKDVFEINGKQWEMNGITVYAPKANNGSGRVYVPRQALDFFRR
ncbi:MAG: alkaline phosphatase [Deltaproteobacteria bacterium]|nr:alkaline phosphatase [Deltaproteobacteria bacterium]